ncbi:MAG TPA: hypothetical protein PLB21_05320 [Actinomycetota bacterium]|nr:hypothetical protein [Actinomycetota bacterium]
MTSDNNVEQTTDITFALAQQDYDTVITLVREAMTQDPMAALADSVINEWIGKRFRNIFITEGVSNPDTLKHSQASFPLNLIDPRSERERVAKRMISNVTDEEIALEMPKAQPVGFSNVTLVFAPGLLTGLLPSLAFQSVWPQLINRFGVRIQVVDAHPMRSTEANVADLEDTLERGIGVSPIDASFITAEQDPVPPGDVILMGYSKGGPDILSLLIARPDLAPRVKAVIGWAGAIGGSYLANDIYEKIKGVPKFNVVEDMSADIGELMLRLAPIVQVNNINRRLDEYDIKGAIESLTTTYREKFLADNAEALANLDIPMFYFTGSTHLLEVPYYQRQGTLELLAYDKYNDMQLTQEQARPPLPTAPHLSMFHANHWDLSYDTFPWYTTLGSTKLKDPFAREPAMAAILLMMSELGLMN